MKTKQQPKIHWLANLWPGLPHLWNRGSWAGLVLAVGFTVLLNVLLVTTLVWTEWMATRVRLIGVGVLTAIWVLAWLESRADWRRFVAELAAGDLADEQPGDRGDRLFGEAVQSYLAGDWVTTEQLLGKLLKLDKKDIEARLMLATLWRHQDRTDEASEQLDRLEQLEAAQPWRHEIASEREKLSSKLLTDIQPPAQDEHQQQTDNLPLAA